LKVVRQISRKEGAVVCIAFVGLCVLLLFVLPG
jgi:hypothetical protein